MSFPYSPTTQTTPNNLSAYIFSVKETTAAMATNDFFSRPLEMTAPQFAFMHKGHLPGLGINPETLQRFPEQCKLAMKEYEKFFKSRRNSGKEWMQNAAKMAENADHGRRATLNRKRPSIPDVIPGASESGEDRDEVFTTDIASKSDEEYLNFLQKAFRNDALQMEDVIIATPTAPIPAPAAANDATAPTAEGSGSVVRMSPPPADTTDGSGTGGDPIVVYEVGEDVGRTNVTSGAREGIVGVDGLTPQSLRRNPDERGKNGCQAGLGVPRYCDLRVQSGRPEDDASGCGPPGLTTPATSAHGSGRGGLGEHDNAERFGSRGSGRGRRFPTDVGLNTPHASALLNPRSLPSPVDTPAEGPRRFGGRGIPLPSDAVFFNHYEGCAATERNSSLVPRYGNKEQAYYDDFANGAHHTQSGHYVEEYSSGMKSLADKENFKRKLDVLDRREKQRLDIVDHIKDKVIKEGQPNDIPITLKLLDCLQPGGINMNETAMVQNDSGVDPSEISQFRATIEDLERLVASLQKELQGSKDESSKLKKLIDDLELKLANAEAEHEQSEMLKAEVDSLKAQLEEKNQHCERLAAALEPADALKKSINVHNELIAEAESELQTKGGINDDVLTRLRSVEQNIGLVNQAQLFERMNEEIIIASETLNNLKFTIEGAGKHVKFPAQLLPEAADLVKLLNEYADNAKDQAAVNAMQVRAKGLQWRIGRLNDPDGELCLPEDLIKCCEELREIDFDVAKLGVEEHKKVSEELDKLRLKFESGVEEHKKVSEELGKLRLKCHWAMRVLFFLAFLFVVAVVGHVLFRKTSDSAEPSDSAGAVRYGQDEV